MYIARLVFIAAILLPLFYACKKDDLANTDRHQLQKIISSTGDSILFTFFTYDVQGRLTSITDSNNNGHVWKTIIDYNNQSNPVKFKVIYSSNPNNVITETTDTLLYNNSNKVVAKLFTSSTNNPYKKINSYTYDATGRLIGDTAYSYWNDVAFSYTTFNYDGNNNVIQWENYSRWSGTMKSEGIITASYNSVNNPYASLGLIAYIIKGENLLLNRHNRVLTTYDDGSTENYMYEYYNNGLLKKVVVQEDISSGSFEVNTEFYYN